MLWCKLSILFLGLHRRGKRNLMQILFFANKFTTFRALASWSKASCLGLTLHNACWFESSWGRNFLMTFQPVYGTYVHPALWWILGATISSKILVQKPAITIAHIILLLGWSFTSTEACRREASSWLVGLGPSWAVAPQIKFFFNNSILFPSDFYIAYFYWYLKNL